MLFAAGQSTSAYLWLFALLELGWGQGIGNTSEIESVPKLSCPAPPQPTNGEWKLHGSLCDGGVDCDISQGSELETGSRLVYKCTPGYKVEGSTDVFCEQGGNWSPLPVCTEIKCSALSSRSKKAICTTPLGDPISCDSPVPLGTKANVSCHLGWRADPSLSNSTETVCDSNGNWEPNTIACIPAACGDVLPPQTPLVINDREYSNFPWHASVYLETTTTRGSEKVFRCGATIIRDNFLLIAAHCIDDKITGSQVNPRKLFVMVGNVVPDYDSPLHDPVTVKKGMVKNVYIDCSLVVISGEPQIALLELQEPLHLPKVILPACLDLEDIATEFNRTKTGKAPLPCSQCQGTEVSQYEVLPGTDSFCAIFINGYAICNASRDDSLVIEQDDLWQVIDFINEDLGLNLEDGTERCGTYPYSLRIRLLPYFQYYS